jgi:hypothetical protein
MIHARMIRFLDDHRITPPSQACPGKSRRGERSPLPGSSATTRHNELFRAKVREALPEEIQSLWTRPGAAAA